METTGYITKGAGYIALLSAIIEQAKHDAQSKDAADAADDGDGRRQGSRGAHVQPSREVRRSRRGHAGG